MAHSDVVVVEPFILDIHVEELPPLEAQIKTWCDRHLEQTPELPCSIGEMTAREHALFDLLMRSQGFIGFLSRHLDREMLATV